MRRNRRNNGAGRVGNPRRIQSVPRLISGRDFPVTFTGKFLINFTTSAVAFTPAQFSLDVAGSALGSRLQTLGSCYEEFRFNQVDLRLHPVGTAVAGLSYAVGYTKVIPTTPPVTYAAVYELTSSRFMDLRTTVPINLTLGKDVLHGGARTWYICNAASGSEAEDSIQGALFVLSSTASVNVIIEFAYSVTFRGATTPSVD